MKYKKKILKLMILVLCLMFTLCCVGCNDKDINIRTNEENQITEQKIEEPITASFETKKYETPFVEFLYPADWKEGENKYSDGDFFLGLSSIDGVSGLAIEKISSKNTKIKDIITEVKLATFCERKIINEGYLNNNIYRMEVLYNFDPVLYGVEYVYKSNNCFYLGTLITEQYNWDNFQEIIGAFEKSFKIK